MNKVSLIAQNSDKVSEANTPQEKSIGNKADQGAVTEAVAGGTIGGITGLLIGLGTLAIPGVGSILLAGGAIGAASGSLVGALIGLGGSEERARIYSDRIFLGHYLIIINGTDAEIDHAKAISVLKS